MEQAKDEDPEEIGDAVLRARIDLVDARAKVAFCEYELARLTREHPDIAAGIPPLEEATVDDFRSDALKSALLRINAASGLGLTGKETDYWLQLEAFARENLDLSDDDLQRMGVDGPAATLEKLAAFIEDRLGGPKGIPFDERVPLLESYKAHMSACGYPAYSDRKLYRAKNFPADGHAFKDWKSGRLSRTSQTSINIERFLQNRETPKLILPTT
jgi:hypothetical protein